MPPPCRTGPRPLAARIPAVLLALLLLGACEQPEQEAPQPPLREPEYDGLSREQIEERASSMTPEEAERLGIIDSTIHIEPPINPDSVIIDDVP